MRPHRQILLAWGLVASLPVLLAGNASTPLAAQDNQSGHLVRVGNYKMFLDCNGGDTSLIVILEAGSGDSSEVWSTVQKEVERSARVCSYDRVGSGRSDKVGVELTADQLVEDLHQLLGTVPVPPPYVMVGHSIGGIYIRKYVARYPSEVKGLVFVDSGHEEQFTRVAAISPAWAQRIASRFPTDPEGLQAKGFLPRNERLTWHFDGPLIVLEHEAMPQNAASDPMAKQSEVVFHELQKDLASRSRRGQLRVAKTSGHYIQRDQPELVTQAIKDVLRECETGTPAKPR